MITSRLAETIPGLCEKNLSPIWPSQEAFSLDCPAPEKDRGSTKPPCPMALGKLPRN